MYCKQCGTQIADDAVYCSKCGTKQDIQSAIINEESQDSKPAFSTYPNSPQTIESAPSKDTHPLSDNDSPLPHTWRCANCGNMIEKEPCIVCARGPQTAVPPHTNNNRVFHCPTCGQQQNHRDYCHSCGQLFTDINASPSTSEFSMRYYNFWVDFMFYAGAAINFITAILYIAGTITVGLDKAVDILFALYSIGMGAFSIVIRDKMVKFQKDGLSWFRAYRYIGIIFGFISMIISLSVLENNLSFLFTEEMLTLYTVFYLFSFAISAGIVAAELSYFKKRESLFIN